MVPDPYLALGLPHDASQVQIKRAYRRLALRYHPDRLQRINASQEEMQRATSEFAACAQAYSLLSDERRKREYDHIYKFGGYDALPQKNTGRNSPDQQENSNPNKRQVPQKGIGYTVVDPFSYIMSQGKVKSKAVAGVTIPSRFNMTHAPGGGFRLSFSSGQLQESPSGTIEYTSKTTQFAHGKKFSKVETTTLHNDGRKEVIIEGDDYVERRISKAAKRKRRSSRDKDDLTHTGDELPWYMSAWNGLRDNLTMCTNSCTGTISVQ
jgi:curved DNA-binding protein CbpA